MTPKPRLPLGLKLGYTAFMAVLVPCYWHLYGPTNFLYFCDLSLFFTLAAVWTESSLLISMPAVGILIPQAYWMVDFLSTAVGMPISGLTNYMFDPAKPLFTRGLSFFHFWLPILIVYLIAKLGYDKRALKMWTAFAFGVLLISYFVLPAPPAPASHPHLPVNVNYVFGLGDDRPQTWMHPHLFFLLILAALPTVCYLPTHLALSRIFRTNVVKTAAPGAPAEVLPK